MSETTTANQLEAVDLDELNAILRRRAEDLAKTKGDNQDRDVTVQIALVAIGDEIVGIPATNLRELVALPSVAPLPGLPESISGVVQIRGELLSVVDLACWLEISSSEERRALVVIEGREGPLGLMVDRVLGFRGVFADEIAGDYVERSSSSARFVKALTTDLVAILDAERLLESEELIVAAGMRADWESREPADPSGEAS